MVDLPYSQIPYLQIHLVIPNHYVWYFYGHSWSHSEVILYLYHRVNNQLSWGKQVNLLVAYLVPCFSHFGAFCW